MVKKLSLLTLLFFLTPGFGSNALFAQGKTPIVEAKFMPDSIAIGDHFELEVIVEKDQVQLVDFPVFQNGGLTEQIEILSEYPADTVFHEGRRMKIRKRYDLTTFEEGEHTPGRYAVLHIDKNITDTVFSQNELRLKVGTYEIDTTTQTIFDIKPVMGAPLKAGEVSGYVLWGLLAGAIVAAAIWLIVRKRKNLTVFGKPKVVDPPHVIAIKALEILHNQKLWQNNKHKSYYSGLTDILREYLEGRYGVRAMEMTSDEILEGLSHTDIDEKSYNGLAQILRRADFVKFARLVPDGDENEQAYRSAYYFVEDTKFVETKPEQDSDQKDMP